MTGQDFSYLLKRGVAEIIVEEEMTELLRSGKRLRLKEGFDPSFPDIHLGHMVALKKLKSFSSSVTGQHRLVTQAAFLSPDLCFLPSKLRLTPKPTCSSSSR